MRLTHLRRSVLVLLVALLALGVGSSGARADTLGRIAGTGSTYVGIAMRQWVAQGQSLGLPVGYTPVGSPTGMNMYNLSQVDYAGTEAEFVSLGLSPSRGYQYVPDVAGATAIMYNVKEQSGRQVDYLHLDRKTVARIFIGSITRWSDPAISATNKGIKLPDQPIRVVLRGNASGTTALFYDFIASTLGAEFVSRFTTYQCGAPDVRPVLIQCAKPGFIPSTISFNDSDQIAQYVAGATGAWSIAFDEFGYAKVYKASSAWIQNAAGKYVLPYAQNISAALESATLRPDLSQDLRSVYASTNPQAYPISAYSYMVTQCAATSARPTCKGPYAAESGKATTLARWMQYIACDGQVTMAAQGYSPLPVNLSQEMANSVGRLTGVAPLKLSASNCNNPRFQGSLGAGAVSPCDPFTCSNAGPSTGGSPSPGAGGTSGGTNGGASGTTGGTTGGTGATGAKGTTGGTSGGTSGAAAGAKSGTSGGSAASGGTAAAGGTAVQQSQDGQVVAVGGGSEASAWKDADPVQFTASLPTDPFGWLPALLVLVAVLAPLSWHAARSRRR